MYLGRIGCEPGCLKCNGTKGSCLLCDEPEFKYLSKGICHDRCPFETQPYYLPYTTFYNNTLYTAYQCMDRCPVGYYAPNRTQADYNRSIPCLKCFGDCQICHHNFPRTCDQCSPVRFLFRGTCLLTCPDVELTPRSIILDTDKFYFNDYSVYHCTLTNRTSEQNLTQFIEVKAVPLGYKRAVPIDELTILKVTLKVKRGRLRGLYMKQMDPYIYTDAKTNFSNSLIKRAFAFEGLKKMDGVSGYLNLDQAWQQMRSATFKYQSELNVYRVLVKAVNDKDDIGYDIFEFYTNRNPVARELIVTSNEKYLNTTMKAWFNITTLNLNLGTQIKGWMDSEDDSINQLFYHMHVQSKNGKFLIQPALFRKEFYIFQMPHLQAKAQFMEVDLYMSATDVHGAQSQKYASLNVTNNYQESKRLYYLNSTYENLTSILNQFLKNNSQVHRNYLQRGTHSKLIDKVNITKLNQTVLSDIYGLQLQIANLFEIGYKAKNVPAYQGVPCLFDEDCHKGICSYESGTPQCLCNPGFTGFFCQLSVNEYGLAKDSASLVIQIFDIYFFNHTYIDAFRATDLQYIVMTMKGLLQNLEAIEMRDISKTMNLLHKTIFAHNHTVFSYDVNFYDDFYETMSRILAKAHYDSVLQKTYSEKGYFEKDFSYQNDLKNVLLKVRQCVDQFSNIILLKMNSLTFRDYQYPFNNIGYDSSQIQDQFLEVKLFSKPSQVFMDEYFNNLTVENTIMMDDKSIITFVIQLPKGAFVDNIGINNNITEMRFKFIAYDANPFLDLNDLTLQENDIQVSQVMESPYVVFEVFDAAMEPIEVDFSKNRTHLYYQRDDKALNLTIERGLLQIQIPYTPIKGFADEHLRCMSHDPLTDKFSLQSCGIQIYDPSTCINCADMLNETSVAVCFCDKLTTRVALAYNFPISIVEPESFMFTVGVYQDSFTLDSWTEGFGFRAVIGAVLIYVVGIFVSIVLDIKPRKRLLLKLMKDLRNIDKFGQKLEEEEKLQFEDPDSPNQGHSNRQKSQAEIKTPQKKKKSVKKRNMFKSYNPNLTNKKFNQDDFYNTNSNLNQTYLDSSSKFMLGNTISKDISNKFDDSQKLIETNKFNMNTGLINFKAKDYFEGGDSEGDNQKEQQELNNQNNQQDFTPNVQQERQENENNELEEIKEQHEDNIIMGKWKAGKNQRDKLSLIFGLQQQHVKEEPKVQHEQMPKTSKWNNFSKSFYLGNEKKETGQLMDLDYNDNNQDKNQQLFVKCNKPVRKGWTQSQFFISNPLNNQTQIVTNNFLNIDQDNINQQNENLFGDLSLEKLEEEISQHQVYYDPLLIGDHKVKKKKGIKKPTKRQRLNILAQPEAKDETSHSLQNLKVKDSQDQKVTQDSGSNDVLTNERSENPIISDMENQKSSENSMLKSSQVIKPDGRAILEDLTQGFTPAFEEPDRHLADELGRDLSGRLKSHMNDNSGLLVIPIRRKKRGRLEDIPTEQNSDLIDEEVVDYSSQGEETENMDSSYDENGVRKNKKRQKKTKEEQNQERDKRYHAAGEAQTQFTQIQRGDDLASRHLRDTRFEDIEEEINLLANSKSIDSARFSNLIKYGNQVVNLIWVDSYLFPRHARWTLLFIDIMLLWFLTGMYFKNTKKPLTILEQDSMKQGASALAIQDMWISFLIPLANSIFVYLISSLFKVTEARFKYSADVHTLNTMINELNKEMRLRLFMSSFLCLCIIVTILWYFLDFTTLYGWKTSWIWFYCGCVAAVLHFVLYDLAFCLLYWLLAKLYEPEIMIKEQRQGNKCVKCLKTIKRTIGKVGIYMCQFRLKKITFEEA